MRRPRVFAKFVRHRFFILAAIAAYIGGNAVFRLLKRSICGPQTCDPGDALQSLTCGVAILAAVVFLYAFQVGLELVEKYPTAQRSSVRLGVTGWIVLTGALELPVHLALQRGFIVLLSHGFAEPTTPMPAITGWVVSAYVAACLAIIFMSGMLEIHGLVRRWVQRRRHPAF